MDRKHLKDLYDLYWKLQAQYHCARPGYKKIVHENIQEIQRILGLHIQDVYTIFTSGKS